MTDKIKVVKAVSLGTTDADPVSGSKYTQQAQARAQKRNVYRAEMTQDKRGMYTLTPEKITSKKSK